MQVRDSLQSQLTQIRDRCEPANFAVLYRQVQSFCEITVSAIQLLPKIQTKQFFYEFCFELIRCRNRLRSCIGESSNKGLLNEFPELRKPTRTEAEAISFSKHVNDPRQQAKFLWLQISTSVATFACSLLDLNNPAVVTAWDMFTQEVRCFSKLAKLAMNKRCKSIGELVAEVNRCTVWEPGFELIDLASPMTLGEADAWGVWIQATQEQPPTALKLLDDCIAKLTRIANFLTLVDVAPWHVRSFTKIAERDSLTAIVQELNKRNLVPTPQNIFSDNTPAALAAQYRILTVGTFRKTSYLVRLPLHYYLAEPDDYSALQRWENDPVAFMRKNWRSIPNSSHAQLLRKELEDFRAIRLDAILEQKFSELVAELTPDALALALVEGCGLPHVTTLVLSPLCRRLIDALRKQEKMNQGEGNPVQPN